MNRLVLLVAALMVVFAFLQLADAQDFRADQPEKNTSALAASSKDDQDDPMALGHPLSYWLNSIEAGDAYAAEMAFDVIVALGPSARKAVPELTRIVGKPYTPIQLDTDSQSDIYAKLLDIHLRAGAMDCLGAIGDVAASSAEAMIRWGLTVRVLPPERPTVSASLLVELIGMDVLERMRAAGSIARLGPEASGRIQALIESTDNEKRKFAAAILSDTTLPIATDLMQSTDCSDRARGVALLSAMWPVVAKEHLTTLEDVLKCSDKDHREKSARTTVRPTGILLIELAPASPKVPKN